MRLNDNDTPRCPVCQYDLIYVERRRITWHDWANVWYCRRCSHEYVIPEYNDEQSTDDVTDDDQLQILYLQLNTHFASKKRSPSYLTCTQVGGAFFISCLLKLAVHQSEIPQAYPRLG